MFVFPHGIHVDAQGNVWVVDGLPPGAGRAGAPPVKGGHHIVKFSPDGKVLLRLGMPGMTGSGRDALQSAVGRDHRARTATSSWPTGTAATATRAS